MTPYEQEMNRLADECIQDFRNMVFHQFTLWGSKWIDFIHNEKNFPTSVKDKFQYFGEECEKMMRIK